MEKLERFDRKLIELEEDKEKCNNNNTAVKVNFKEAENSSIIK
jgi:hypothetical protein